MSTPSHEQSDPVTLNATPVRRGAVLSCLTGLAGALLLQGWDATPLRQAGALAVAIGCAALARAVWTARHDRLVWDADGLRDGSGRLRVPRAQIAAVDRGMVSLRPSQGFTLRLRREVAPGWSVGLWWARGRAIGIGGLVNREAVRALATRIAADLARDPPSA